MAPIFGFDNGTVVASATEEWTLGVANPVPLKLNAIDVAGCNDGHQPGYTGPECYFAFAKSGSGSQRGWLDFPQGWPTDNNDPTRCTSQAGGANELGEYIDNMGLEGSIALQATPVGPAPNVRVRRGRGAEYPRAGDARLASLPSRTWTPRRRSSSRWRHATARHHRATRGSPPAVTAEPIRSSTSPA